MKKLLLLSIAPMILSAGMLEIWCCWSFATSAAQSQCSGGCTSQEYDAAYDGAMSYCSNGYNPYVCHGAEKEPTRGKQFRPPARKGANVSSNVERHNDLVWLAEQALRGKQRWPISRRR